MLSLDKQQTNFPMVAAHVLEKLQLVLYFA